MCGEVVQARLGDVQQLGDLLGQVVLTGQRPDEPHQRVIRVLLARHRAPFRDVLGQLTFRRESPIIEGAQVTSVNCTLLYLLSQGNIPDLMQSQPSSIRTAAFFVP